ncbi:hypothetical protein UFOVP112_455 [uncultured Caudovirales phage]|uniref:Uncharacterized protein n=1 Tax=uncultured Caudovirales phage TaxID=2100421 RepID=A0A6J5L8L3_9CAUD|nr:hypothetical protein UFOVP112_455 [uncultured Caudovirales phage]
MKEHLITVDVYAHWVDHCPRYRVYVDNDLLTERDFIWQPREVYICENILVTLAPGTHTVTIEQVSAHGKIEAKNITVDGVASATEFTITE